MAGAWFVDRGSSGPLAERVPAGRVGGLIRILTPQVGLLRPAAVEVASDVPSRVEGDIEA